jgi:hypothetical protein
MGAWTCLTVRTGAPPSPAEEAAAGVTSEGAPEATAEGTPEAPKPDPA